MKTTLLSIALAVLAILGASTQTHAQAPANVQTIDLGLPSGIYWASCNVGATTPQGYGDYFAWGETETKDYYGWTTYKYTNGGYGKMTKYCNDASHGDNGFTDMKTVLEAEDDAAAANWGNAWRMPTDAEWAELLEHCTWEWIKYSQDTFGYVVTSKTNGNSIFLPAAGYLVDDSRYNAGMRGNYWSSSLNEDKASYARYIEFQSSKQERTQYGRFYGRSVRAVRETVFVAPAYVPKPFSVAEGKQITFSGGNLQYRASTTTWRFAENQYDYIGSDNANISNTYTGWIDLFGWSGSTGSAKWGIGISTDNADYSGDFVDWGTNTIGTDAPDTWRTLTNDEWDYLLFGRTNADNLIGAAHINLNTDGSEYANGIVLLPDQWICPVGVTFKSGYSDTYSVQAYADYQIFTLSDWQQLEAAGAVFLPASGYRYGSDVDNMQYNGNYWSATCDDFGRADYLYFLSNGTGMNHEESHYYGKAVRLVKDCSNTDLANPFVAETAIPARKVLRDGQILVLRNGVYYDVHGRVLNP